MLKIKNTNFKTNVISLLSIFFILLALGIFGYYYYYKDDNDIYARDNFTISAAMANANKPGVIICAIIEFILVFYLHNLRKNYSIIIFGGILIAIIISVIISILYITPENNPNAHIVLAGIGFASILIYNFLVLSILYVNYKQLWLLILLLLPNFAIAVALILGLCYPYVVIGDDNGFDTVTKLNTLFAIKELILIFLLLVTLFLLGFYRREIKNNKKKKNIKSKQLKE